jgi:putative oxidoreductase
MQDSSSNRCNDFALLLIRLILAAIFIYHGGGKLFGWFGGHGLHGTAGFFAEHGIPYPQVAAVLSGATEFFGGLVLVLGIGTRLVAIPMAFNMAVACTTVHYGAFAAPRGMEYPLTLAVVLVVMVALGPGRFTACRCCWCKCAPLTETPAAPSGQTGS